MADRDRLFGPPCGPYMIGGVGGAWGEGLAWEVFLSGVGAAIRWVKENGFTWSSRRMRG